MEIKALSANLNHCQAARAFVSAAYFLFSPVVVCFSSMYIYIIFREKKTAFLVSLFGELGPRSCTNQCKQHQELLLEAGNCLATVQSVYGTRIAITLVPVPNNARKCFRFMGKQLPLEYAVWSLFMDVALGNASICV